MKRRIFSLLVTLVVAVSVVVGVSLTANAADEPTDRIVNSGISVAENVTLIMEVAVAEPAEDAVATITPPDGTTTTVPLAEAQMLSGNYLFFAEVAIKDIDKPVTIEIKKADGTYFEGTTSVSDYCKQYLADPEQIEFNGLVEALKAYGAAADCYFDDTKTADSVASADFSNVKDLVKGGTLPEGIKHRSVTLFLETETTIRHYFELAEGKYIENYTFFVDLDKDNVCDVNEKLTPNIKDNGIYYVEIPNLTPNMLDNMYRVGVYGKADGTTYTCDYGALTYAKRSYAKSDIDTKNLAAAILAYSAEASELKGTITFNADGGSTVANQTYEYGVAKPIVAPTAKDGAIFLGWADANGNVVTTVPANATGDVALTAKWSEAKTAYTNGFDTYNYIGKNVCDNHKDGNTDGICDACSVCIDTANCAVYKGTAKDANTKCPTCGQIRVKSSAVGPFSYSDYVAGFCGPVQLTDGNKATLFAVSGAGPTVTYGSATTDNFYNIIYDENGNLKAKSITFTMTVGKPTQEQIASVFDGKTVLGSITDQYIALDFRLYTKTSKNDSGDDVFNSNGTAPSDKMRYPFQIAKNGIIKCGTTSTTLKCTEGSLNTFSLVIDVTETSSDGVANDKLIMTLYDGEGNYVYSKSETLPLDISLYKLNIGQLRMSGAGYLLIDDMTITTQAINNNVVNYNGSAPDNYYTPGVATKLPTPTKDGFEFAGWFADEALTQPIDEVPTNAVGEFKVYAKWDEYLLNQGFDEDTEGISVPSQPAVNPTPSNGVFTWTPTMKEDGSGQQGSGITYNGDAFSGAVTTNRVTYRFEIGKAGSLDFLETRFRCYATINNKAANEVNFFSILNDGSVVVGKPGEEGPQIAELGDDGFVKVDVVVDFKEKTLKCYVGGLLVNVREGVDLAEVTSYVTNTRCLQIYPNAKTSYNETPTEGLAIGKIQIIDGNIYE